MTANELVPESLEEAGALLGAAVLKCGLTTTSSSSDHQIMVAPPKGMHSSFATSSAHVPLSDLFLKLKALRAHLHPNQPLPVKASPSILAVLMKLLGVSSSMASNKKVAPLLSTPLRLLWVDCVVQCHVLGDGLTGKTANDIFAFVRSMMALAGLNPKSSKAAGGTRIAALLVLGGLFREMPTKLAPWALDVLLLCLRGLKSSGNGEPTHRIASVQTACSIMQACRIAALKSSSIRSNANAKHFVLRGALEDRAILEVVKLLKHAANDKYPEVRTTTAKCAGMAAPMLILQKNNLQKSDSNYNQNTPPTASLEDVLGLSMKNIDDESAGVAVAWSEALARCLCTSIEYGQELRATASERNASARSTGRQETPSPSHLAAATATSATTSNNNDAMRSFASRKSVGITTTCSTHEAAIQFLVSQFIKQGGELAASRLGGSFSMGGRAVRIGLSVALVKLLGLQSYNNLELTPTIHCVLQMVGPDVLKQLRTPQHNNNLDAIASTTTISTSTMRSSSPLFSSSRYKSHADAGLARLATSRVLRQGLSEMVSEPTLVSMLHEFIKLCGGGGGDNVEQLASNDPPLNSHQLQVVLIEISHVVTTLGQACAASRVDLIPALKKCLSHEQHGVRHEAALACAAVVTAFPNQGKEFFKTSLEEVQIHHAELVTLACTGPEHNKVEDHHHQGVGVGGRMKRRGFRRSSPEKTVIQDKSLVHQYTIHGHALLISILLKEMPRLDYGGLETTVLSTGLSVAEILLSCQYSEILNKGNANASCTCVRAGYGIISGILATGANAIAPHIDVIFGSWTKSSKSAAQGSKHFTLDHDLICLDAALSSIVVFLKYCSELLMVVPDALSKTSQVLEAALPLFLPEGRLGSASLLNPAAASRLSSANASLMEAFAWLPPGSFPLIADKLFAFAAIHIQSGTEEDVTCSILSTLVNNEDKLLDAKTMSRAQRPGQVGGARDVQENLVVLTSEAAHHGERESVLHFFSKPPQEEETSTFLDSQILGLYASEGSRKTPTPLHQVATWREPTSPSSCAKVRLIDAAIQAFAATFSMKDGKEQQLAMDMLESLVPPLLAQLARAIGVNTALTEPERRSKTKEESAAVANITAVLLACLKALPVDEATHNVPIGLGPRWMNKAKDLLLTVLPSASNLVRRAAAEGLALLATLGVSGDAHTLQSAVLHSLDEVMQGNQPDGKPRPIPLEPVTAARAGSLLTLACIQRTSYCIKKKQSARTPRNNADQDEGLDASLPTIQMMTRVLPSISCNVLLRDAFVVRTYALHAFALLISYSSQLDTTDISAEDEHLLRKAVEAVESNFLASWTAASTDFDQGQEAEKLASEAAFLSVLLRMMTFLLPSLYRLKESDSGIAFRFAHMATSIVESCSSHPNVLMEGMAFFERLSAFPDLLPTPSSKVPHSGNVPYTFVPLLLESIKPEQLLVHDELTDAKGKGCFLSPLAKRAGVLCVKLLAQAQIVWADDHDTQVPALLMALLEVTCGNRCFGNASLYRSIAAPIEAELVTTEHDLLEVEIVDALDTILLLDAGGAPESGNGQLLHWILLARALFVGTGKIPSDRGTDPLSRAGVIERANIRALQDAAFVLDYGSPSRWQVKCQAARAAHSALTQTKLVNQIAHGNAQDAPDFDLSLAEKALDEECRKMRGSQSERHRRHPSSFAIFHLVDILSAACSASVSTLDQSELLQLQQTGLGLLNSLVSATAHVRDPDHPAVSILDQHTTQIFASVKHGLNALSDSDGDPSYQLFLAGCEGLRTIVEQGLVTDPLILKRMVRLVIPKPSEIPFHPYGFVDGKSPFWIQDEESQDTITTSLLPTIGKLWTLSELRCFADRGIIVESSASPLYEELSKSEKEMAIHCAASAIDGSRLLRAHGLSLCGAPQESQGEAEQSTHGSCEAGLLYSNFANLDESTKAALVHSWPACASNAITCLVDILTRDSTSEEYLKSCSLWLEKIVPVAFSGLYDSLAALSSQLNPETSHLWSKGLSGVDVSIMCLHGIRALVGASLKGLADLPGKEELGTIVEVLSKSVLVPVLTPKPASSEDKEALDVEGVVENRDLKAVVSETCHLLEELAESELMTGSASPPLIRAVLTPLHRLKNGEIDVEDELTADVLASSLRSAKHFVDKADSGEDMVKAMLDVALDILSKEAHPEILVQASSSLLMDCFKQSSINAREQRKIAKELANAGKWDVWALVCNQMQSVSGFQSSVSAVREALGDLSNVQRHLKALGAVRSLVQSAPIESTIVGFVMNGVGDHLLMLLQFYGTTAQPEAQERRMPACAGCIKIIMLGYQHLTLVGEEENDELIATFLLVVFEVLVNIMLFNGLPNHPSPTTPSGVADPNLGRMSAQATMHVVRTSPTLFKSSMASMSDQGRAVLEMAVKGEMSGYAYSTTQEQTQTVPSKKKLSLKGFTK